MPENYDDWNDKSIYNTKLVYRNADPSKENWELHSSLLEPRAFHNTINLNNQLYHIAGYARGFDDPFDTYPVTGRKVEVWESIVGDNKTKTEDKLYNYIHPQSFIVSDTWYKNCELQFLE